MLSLTGLTRLFLPAMVERGVGRILNVASVVAYFSGGPHWATYVATKSYVLSFTKALAVELRDTGVTATTLCPGPTATHFVKTADVGDTRIYRWLPQIPARRIAIIGYRAAMKGRGVVVPGFINKVLAFLGELPPRAIALTVFGYLARNNTKAK